MRKRLMGGGALCAIVVSLAACGAGGSQPKSLSGNNDPAATSVAQRYIDAYHADDAAKICRLVAANVVAQLGGHKCVKTVRATNKGVGFPELKATRSFANGTTAVVTFQNTSRQVTVTRQGKAWKVINGGT